MPAGQRQAAIDAANEAAEPSEAALAAKEANRQALEKRYWQLLCNWTHASEASRFGSQAKGTRVPAIGTASEESLARWDAEFTGLGYAVSRDRLFYYLSMPDRPPQ